MRIDARVGALKSRTSPDRAGEIEKATKRFTDLKRTWKQCQVWGFTSEVPGEGHGPRSSVKLDDPVTFDNPPRAAYVFHPAR